MAGHSASSSMRLKREVITASDGSRYLLAVRAPGIGLNAFEAGEWHIIERRSSAAQIGIFFERAKAFLGDRGQVVVVAQRVQGREVHSFVHLRHRVAGAIEVHHFKTAIDSDRNIFWNCVDRYLRNAAEAARRAVPAVKLATAPRGAAPKANSNPMAWVRPTLVGSAWVAATLVVAVLLTWSPVRVGLQAAFDMIRYRYG